MSLGSMPLESIVRILPEVELASGLRPRVLGAVVAVMLINRLSESFGGSPRCGALGDGDLVAGASGARRKSAKTTRSEHRCPLFLGKGPWPDSGCVARSVSRQSGSQGVATRDSSRCARGT
jgi:hypothetical protein